jgi:hypothetical protein
VQEPGNYILTFPYAYHAGFNAGFNCAEATNFAPADWLPFGLEASERYSEDARYCSVAHDKMLVDLGAAVCQPGAHPSLAPTVAAELDRRVLLETQRRGDAAAWAETEERMSHGETAFCADNDCSVCLADLHLSALFCACSPDKPTCLRHTGCACAPSQRRLAFNYTLQELRQKADAVRAVSQPGMQAMRPLAERFDQEGRALPTRPLATAQEADAAFQAALAEAEAKKRTAKAERAERAAAQDAAAERPAEAMPPAALGLVH